MANFKRRKFKSRSMKCPICGSQRRLGSKRAQGNLSKTEKEGRKTFAEIMNWK